MAPASPLPDHRYDFDAIIYYLLKNRHCYDKLMAELDDAAGTGRIPSSDPSEVRDLPQGSHQGISTSLPIVGCLLMRKYRLKGCKNAMFEESGSGMQRLGYASAERGVFGEDYADFEPEEMGRR